MTETQGSQQRDLLSTDMLERFRERAPIYDQENRFCQEDFDELHQCGYLKMAIPTEFGGLGFNLSEVCYQTRRLATYAAPTALCTNMHIYWTGVCSELHKQDDHSLDWVLEQAGQGAVLAAGHGEKGNDLPILFSTTTAQPVDGGYVVNGHKSFGSLTPVWDWIGIHAQDNSDPDNPKIVHAFVPREAEGISILETWDVMGMRATRSDDTLLENVFVPSQHVARVVPAGFAGADLFVLSIFACALVPFGVIYEAIAQRCLELVTEMLEGKTSLGLSRDMRHHAEVQHGIAEMVLDLETIQPHLERIAQDWADGVDHGSFWALKIVAAKYHAVETGWRVVDQAMELSGGWGMFRKTELERLFRDARAGRFHPANSALTHEIAAKTVLGLDMDDQPRWG